MNTHSDTGDLEAGARPVVEFSDLESDICDLHAMIDVLMELQDNMFDHPDKTEGPYRIYKIPRMQIEGRTVLMTQIAQMSERLRERFYAAHETSRATQAVAT